MSSHDQKNRIEKINKDGTALVFNISNRVQSQLSSL